MDVEHESSSVGARSPGTKRKNVGPWKGWIRRGLLMSLFSYTGIVVLLSIFETKLVYPAPEFDAGDWEPAFQYEDVRFQSNDGTQLHGWLFSAPPGEGETRWILYCHGNGTHVAKSGAYIDALRTKIPANIFLFDYRGYGLSQGSPHEAGVLADSEAALAWLSQRSGREPNELILMGRSLGGGVAVHLASEHGAKALVLERTFSRLTDAAKAKYWWVPVDWMMKNRYPSVEKISNYSGPLLCSHGEKDRLVPWQQGKQLFDAAATPIENKTFVTMEDIGHGEPGPEHYYDTLIEFLRQN